MRDEVAVCEAVCETSTFVKESFHVMWPHNAAHPAFEKSDCILGQSPGERTTVLGPDFLENAENLRLFSVRGVFTPVTV